MLNWKFAMTDGTGDTKLLALLDSGASFSFISSLVAKCLGLEIQPNNTSVAVKLVHGRVVHSSSVANDLVSSNLWQAYMTFLVLDIPFKVMLCMPWLPHICPPLDWGTKGLHLQQKGCFYRLPTVSNETTILVVGQVFSISYIRLCQDKLR